MVIIIITSSAFIVIQIKRNGNKAQEDKYKLKRKDKTFRRIINEINRRSDINNGGNPGKNYILDFNNENMILGMKD